MTDKKLVEWYKNEKLKRGNDDKEWNEFVDFVEEMVSMEAIADCDEDDDYESSKDIYLPDVLKRTGYHKFYYTKEERDNYVKNKQQKILGKDLK